MLSIQYPQFFLLLLLLPLYFALKRYGLGKTPALPLPLGNWNGLEPEKHTVTYFFYYISYSFLLLCVVLVITALTEPVYITHRPMYTGHGNAIMFVIDTSPSIAAQDMGSQTRLEVAKQTIRRFTEAYSGDSFGLTAFGSTAAVLIPPTIDTKTFLSRLDSLQAGELGEGTAIGMGLAAAVLHITQYTTIPAAIVLLTDGDNNAGEIPPHLAAEMICHKHIGFYVVGLGKSGYAPIRYFDPIQKKNISGTLHSTFDESELKKLAQTGNGRYFSAHSPEMLQDIFKRLEEKIPASQPVFTKQKMYYLESLCYAAALCAAAISWSIRRLGMKAVLI
ncbi:MAG: vWA domain-containing protein [Treponema sp.]